MTGQAGLDFRGLLRQLRDEAGLTQEELAGAARVSQRAVSDLERGINRTARKDTALLLAGALGLDGQARERFVAAARGHARAEEALAAVRGDGAGGPAAASRTLPRDIPAFTGRQEELEQLMARWAETGDGRGRRGGGHPCDRRDGRDRQDDTLSKTHSRGCACQVSRSARSIWMLRLATDQATITVRPSVA